MPTPVAPDVMQQFNTLKDRVAAASLPNGPSAVARPTGGTVTLPSGAVPEGSVTATVLPSGSDGAVPTLPTAPADAAAGTAATPETTIKRDIVDPATGETKLIAYSTTGQLQTKEQFTKAFDVYKAKGNRVEGFTFLEPGTLKEILRSGFETVNQPLQKGAASLSTLIDNFRSADPEFAVNKRERTGPGVPTLLAESVNTPQKAGAAVGTAVGAGLTGGMSLVPQLIATGLGAGVGSLTGDMATGSNEGKPETTISETAQAVALAAVGQGLVGGFKQFLSRGLSQQAQQQASGDLVTLLKNNVAGFTNDPQALEILASTRKGANDLITVGIKALRGDIDTVRYGFISTMVTPSTGGKAVPGLVRSKVAPGQFSADQFIANVPGSAGLSKATVTEVKTLVRKLAEQGNTLLDNIGDDGAYTKAWAAMDVTRNDIGKAIAAEFTGASAPIRAAQDLRVKQLLADQVAQLNKFRDAAEVLHYMKQSVGPQGFDPALMQKLLQTKGGQNPGSLKDQATDTVFRGAKDRLAGTDAAVKVPVPIGAALSKVPVIGRIPGIGGLNTAVPIGKKYVGNVKGQYPMTEAAAAHQTLQAINDYLGKKKKR